MTTAADCPDHATLQTHAENKLPRSAAATIDAHLASCAACFARFIDLGHPSLFPRIPDCHIVQEIGRGRFGVVYKAWWIQGTPRIVALKVLSSAGEMETVRFDREIAVLEKLDSPGIVKCFSSGSTGDGKFYLMDYVEGSHLDEYLSTQAHSLQERLAIFVQVCRAVADAHAMGVIHRDLKPRNILVDRQGRPHVLDFGICTVSESDWTSWARYTITQPGDVIGTLKYMSPEQAWGGASAPVSARSDLWALGVMLHEIVTEGGYPFPLGSTPEKPAHEALLDRIRKELPRLPNLRKLPHGRDLEVLLERCLAWEPHRRLDSAAKLADDLERYGAGLRIHTKPFPIRYRLHRLAVAAAVRSPWMFWVTFLALLGFVLQAGAFAFRVGWHVQGREYGSRPALASKGSNAVPARDEILLAGIQDDTVPAVLAFAAEKGWPEVTKDVTTWRGVHGYMMDRLAVARPKAVVWDFYFRTPQPEDERLVAAVEQLEHGGVPVVLAALGYSREGIPDLSPAILTGLGRGLRHGAILARDSVNAPGEFLVALQRSEQVIIPGAVLTALGAILHPEARIDLEWAGRLQPIQLMYEVPARGYLRERDRVETLSTEVALQDQLTTKKGDLLAFARVPLAPPEHWVRNTVAYHDLLGCTEEDLKLHAGGKTVLFGDLRTALTHAAPDRHPVRYESSVVDGVPGCYLVADAIAGLLDQRYIKAAFPMGSARFLAMLALGTLACLVSKFVAERGFFSRPAWRFWSVPILLLGAAACGAVSATSKRYGMVHLGLAGFSFLAPLSAALWVQFARNRHRILDVARKALGGLDGFGPTSDGTITLASQRGKSLPEIK